MARVTENQVAFAVTRISMGQADGVASFRRCRAEVPNHLTLSAEDQEQSTTRPNEEMWEQQIRNIKSHSESAGNYICEGYLEHVPGRGYRVTDAGRRKRMP